MFSTRAAAAFALCAFCVVAQSAPAQSTKFEWARALNEAGNSVLTGIGVDRFGNTYVAGHTWSAQFPVRNAVQAALAAPGSEDMFVAKLDDAGNLVYATYFGGTGYDEATAVAVDGAGNVFVAGRTNS